MRAILTVYSIDDSGSVLSFAPHDFENIIKGVTERGVPIVSIETLLSSSKPLWGRMDKVSGHE